MAYIEDNHVLRELHWQATHGNESAATTAKHALQLIDVITAEKNDLRDELAAKSEKLEELQIQLNQLTSMRQKIQVSIASRFLNPATKGFYGTIHGGSTDEEKVIYIEKKDGNNDLGINHDCIYYLRGKHGHDDNIYSFWDYGITWAWTLEDLPGAELSE